MELVAKASFFVKEIPAQVRDDGESVRLAVLFRDGKIYVI